MSEQKEFNEQTSSVKGANVGNQFFKGMYMGINIPESPSVKAFNLYEVFRGFCVKAWACTGVSLLLFPNLWVGQVFAGIAVMLTVVALGGYMNYAVEANREYEGLRTRLMESCPGAHFIEDDFRLMRPWA